MGSQLAAGEAWRAKNTWSTDLNQIPAKFCARAIGDRRTNARATRDHRSSMHVREWPWITGAACAGTTGPARAHPGTARIVCAREQGPHIQCTGNLNAGPVCVCPGTCGHKQGPKRARATEDHRTSACATRDHRTSACATRDCKNSARATRNHQDLGDCRPPSSPAVQGPGTSVSEDQGRARPTCSKSIRKQSITGKRKEH